MLDRFLVTAEASDVEPVICINKMDLAKLENVQRELKLYEELGYKVVYTSIMTGLGVDGLREVMQNKISAIVGSSGVGKSSLLNALQPGLELRTGEVDTRIHKGRHTTTEVMLAGRSNLVDLLRIHPASGHWVCLKLMTSRD